MFMNKFFFILFKRKKNENLLNVYFLMFFIFDFYDVLIIEKLL